ncbi:hypothetical protein IttPL_0022 [Pseudomonas phage ITTPL]|uniref:Uncharacterized protein n=1 Tax=Pseudomonas phage ITTPL TaxID=2544984 RepID=A0A5B7LW36_9CAUD|nr:hypothetical protein QE324_gp022 [Pseudomonas phage ITTPL]QBP28037.1 hypothetical protein IttPL_0022 [Pseudomonas phage ITTPL]
MLAKYYLTTFCEQGRPENKGHKMFKFQIWEKEYWSPFAAVNLMYADVRSRSAAGVRFTSVERFK